MAASTHHISQDSNIPCGRVSAPSDDADGLCNHPIGPFSSASQRDQSPADDGDLRPNDEGVFIRGKDAVSRPHSLASADNKTRIPNRAWGSLSPQESYQRQLPMLVEPTMPSHYTENSHWPSSQPSELASGPVPAKDISLRSSHSNHSSFDGLSRRPQAPWADQLRLGVERSPTWSSPSLSPTSSPAQTPRPSYTSDQSCARYPAQEGTFFPPPRPLPPPPQPSTLPPPPPPPDFRVMRSANMLPPLPKVSWAVSNTRCSQASISDKTKRVPRNFVVSGEFPGYEEPDQSQKHLVHDIGEPRRLLQEQRSKVRAMKSQMAETRKELRSLRQKTANADNAFMAALRPLLVDNNGFRASSRAPIEARMSLLQSLRTDYHVLEDSYEGLEEDLESHEQHLGWIELRCSSLLGTDQSSLLCTGQNTLLGTSRRTPPTAVTKRREPMDLPIELQGISPNKTIEDLHPLFVDLTLAVANMQVRREDLCNLMEMKRRCEADTEVEPTPGQTSDFSADFSTQRKKMQHKVQKSEAEFERLRGLCEEKNVMATYGSVHPAAALFHGADFEDIVLSECKSDDPEASLAHGQFGELLSQPSHLLANPHPLTAFGALKAAEELDDDDPEKPAKRILAAKEYGIDRLLSERDSHNQADFVNRWLLYNLRLSSLEAQRLYLIFGKEAEPLRICDVRRWQFDVLYYWSRDDTATTAYRMMEAYLYGDSESVTQE